MKYLLESPLPLANNYQEAYEKTGKSDNFTDRKLKELSKSGNTHGFPALALTLKNGSFIIDRCVVFQRSMEIVNNDGDY